MNYKLVPTPVLVTSIAVAAALLGDAMLYVVMPSSPELWSLTIVQIGILLSANRFIRLITNPLSAVCIEKYGIYNPFKIALIASLVVLVIYATSSSFTLLLLARLLWGTCWSILRLVSQWVASDQSDDNNLGFNHSSNASIIRLGSIGGALFGGILSDFIGYRYAIAIFGIFTIASYFPWIRKSTYAGINTQTSSSPRGSGFFLVLKDVKVLSIGICGLVVGLAFSGLLGSTLGHFLRFNFGTEFNIIYITIGVASLTGILLGFKSSAEVFVGPFAGLLSDKYGRLRTLIISASVFSVGLSLLGLFDSLLVIYALLFLAFTGGVMLMMQLLSLVGVIAEGDRKSDIFSCYNTFQDVGSAIGPFMGLSLIQGENLGTIYLLSGLLVYFLIICLCFYYRNAR